MKSLGLGLGDVVCGTWRNRILDVAEKCTQHDHNVENGVAEVDQVSACE